MGRGRLLYVLQFRHEGLNHILHIIRDLFLTQHACYHIDFVVYIRHFTPPSWNR